jgi:MoaA/NifB/PqqE/SkfB family radical SAM enzyme
MYKIAKYLFYKRAPVPIYLNHFITRRCNAHCPHCFAIVGSQPQKKDELTLDEIEKVTKSFRGNLFHVNITGGEPFLRVDIKEILIAYIRYAGVKTMQVLTNASCADKIKEIIPEIAEKYRNTTIILGFSIDDTSERHDKYRGLGNAYSNTISTYLYIKKLNIKNIDMDVGITVTSENQDRIKAVHDELLSKGVNTISCSLARGDEIDEELKRVDMDKYIEFVDILNKETASGILKNLTSFRGASLLNAKANVLRKLIYKTVVVNQYHSPCYAGRLAGVLDADGEVKVCEMINNRVGNVREYNYDFGKVWTNNAIKRILMEKVDNQCFCTHECFGTLNVMFNFRNVLWVFLEFCRNQVKKRLMLLSS